MSSTARVSTFSFSTSSPLPVTLYCTVASFFEQCALQEDLNQELEDHVVGMIRQNSYEEDGVVPSVPTRLQRAPSLGDLSDESSLGK